MNKLVITIIIVWGACACSTAPEGAHAGTEEEMRYDELQLKGQWQDIIDEAARHPIRSAACRKVFLLAQIRLGLAGREALMECLSNPKQALTSERGALMVSDVYIQLGHASLAQRAAFEAMVASDDDRTVTRALQRLAETALITGQTELARKYIYILRERGVSRKWMDAISPLAEHPELIMQDPTFKELRKQYEETEDQFFL